MLRPTPHGDKLRALLDNAKLPEHDRPRIHSALEKYENWITAMEQLEGRGGQIVEPMTAIMNRYRQYLDLDLVFDSREDFLYRQKGQLKLDNTVMEEFLPYLVGRVFSDRIADLGLTLGPANAFAQMRFESHLGARTAGGGMAIRSKAHDFAMARPLFLKASHHHDFRDSREARTHLAYVAAEIKTNLDKTMFQEASATAYDLKVALPNSRYFLLCEWLDMTPVSTAVTAIEEVLVLRKARRLPAEVRARFSTAEGRLANRDLFAGHLTENPVDPDALRRFLSHLERLLIDVDERDILNRGWF